jgi:hypothetical protein
MKTGPTRQAIEKMQKITLCLAVYALLVALDPPGPAQQAKKVARIAYLSMLSPSGGRNAMLQQPRGVDYLY